MLDQKATEQIDNLKISLRRFKNKAKPTNADLKYIRMIEGQIRNIQLRASRIAKKEAEVATYRAALEYFAYKYKENEDGKIAKEALERFNKKKAVGK